MEYVVDASVAIKWFLPEPLSDKAERVLRDFLHSGVRLVAPGVLIPEVSNVLWKRAILLKDISASDARESLADLLRLGLTIVPSSTVAERAFGLAAQEKHPVYDMRYLALAVRRRCELITADQALCNKLRTRFPQIRWLGSL